jgi:hypothetical protein
MRGIQGLQRQGTAAQVGSQRWASWCPKLLSSPRGEPQTESVAAVEATKGEVLYIIYRSACVLFRYEASPAQYM